LPKMLVPKAVKDTTAQGVAASISPIWSTCFLGYKPAGPQLKAPSCGYTFMKSLPRVRSWMDDERNAKAIEVEVKVQPKIVASLTGYLILGS